MRYDDDVDLVLAARDGDADAFGMLFDRWFDRVHDVAYRILRDKELAAEVAQDVFLVAWTHLNTIEQPASFGGWLLRTARNRALNRLDRERRSVAVSDEETLMHAPRDEPEVDPGAALHRNEQVDLVWAAAAALGERDASVLDLHLRHSLGAPELAEALGVTVNNAHQLLFRLRKRLAAAVRGWVLWRGGQPVCAELGSILAAAGITVFGPAAVTRIEAHSGGCAGCTSRRDQRLAPEAMFAAVPIIAVAPLVRSQAASALEAAGVPMQGSTALGPKRFRSSQGQGQGPGSATGPTGPTRASGAAEGPGGSKHRSRSRRRRAQVLVSVGIVLIVAATMLMAEAVDDAVQPTTSLASASTSASSTTATSSTSSSSTLPSSTTSSTSQPDRVTTTTVTTTRVTPPTPPPTPPDDGSTTTDPPTADPPVIGGFRIVMFDKVCVDNTVVHTATWSTTDATSATVGVVGGTASEVPASGTFSLCALPGSTFELSATGPGGTTVGTASAGR